MRVRYGVELGSEVENLKRAKERGRAARVR